MKKTYVIGYLFFACLTVMAQTEKVIDWKSDIDTFKKELPLRHKNLFFQLSKKDYESSLDNISSNLSHLSDLEVSIKLQQLISRIGDSHTGINYGKFINTEKRLPIQLYWFKDGIYVIQTIKDYENLIGTRISKINGFDIQVIADSLSTLITVDNNALIKNNIPGLIPYLELLEYFGFSKSDEINVEVESSQNQLMSFQLKANKTDRNNVVYITPANIALYSQNRKSYFVDKYFENDSIYYLQYNACYSKESPPPGYKGNIEKLPSFKDFVNNVFNTIQNKPVRKLVFDMRLNGGGSSMQGTEFITKLSELGLTEKDTKIYVVIGRKTFSSAIINAMDFKAKTKAIFVGEETGGKPNHFGEVRTFQLPSSGLAINYSTKYFTESKENLKTISPDVWLEPTFLDYKAGVDPVYEWIKKQ